MRIAKDLGYEPVDPEKLQYIAVPGYVAPQADILAVACPYEPPRFEDAAKNNKEASELAVKDIVELLADAMGD